MREYLDRLTAEGASTSASAPAAHSLDCAHTRNTPPQAPREPSSALVDAALALDELIQRLGIRLVRRCVPHDPRPLAPSSFVGLGRVGGAPNDRGERVFPIRHFQPLQAQRPASSVDFPAFRRPPGHQVVHGGQVAIDRVPVPGGLAVSPGIADPLQVLAQGFRRVRNGLFGEGLGGNVEAECNCMGRVRWRRISPRRIVWPRWATATPALSRELSLLFLRENHVPVILIGFRNRFLALAPSITGRYGGTYLAGLNLGRIRT